jgi:tRNA A-37 threonylcarbamoyl transferase component Bud32
MDGRVITADELAKATRFGELVPVYKIDSKIVVKTGDSVREAEAAAMKLVSDKTSIPVPKIYNVYTDTATGHVRIIMEFIDGDRLCDTWDEYSSDEKDEVLNQLRDYVTQLRTLKGSFIGSVDGTCCEDQMFTDEIGAYGPYTDEESFNKGIATAVKNTLTGSWVDRVADMVMTLNNHDTVMTHGDLNPRNVLVKGSKVVAVLDWEMAGFYPEYWEYVKALYRPDWNSSWIKDRAVENIMKPYLPELAIILHARDIVW